MNYTERLSKVTVLGAAGKMGSGILLLTALEMTDLKLQNPKREYVLNAIDVSSEALSGLLKYIKTQVLKSAEKKINFLRDVYAERSDLIENSDIINEYVSEALQTVRTSTRIESSYDSFIIFEAIKEDPELKTRLFRQIDENNSNSPWFFTNTSSIPISLIDQEASLDGRIIGFHFYNPPAVQKLIEIIKSNNTKQAVSDFAYEFANKLRKVTVDSYDVAGFIGNGHFMRDALYGLNEAQRISTEQSFPEAVFRLNKVSQELLVRPMGIFQLIDYVGIDVVSYIMSVMNPYLENENLYSEVLDLYLSQGISGGQNSDGSQKNGFLEYERGRITGIYDPQQKNYLEIEPFETILKEEFSHLNLDVPAWKNIIRSRDKEDQLKAYFNNLRLADTDLSRAAIAFGHNSGQIARMLVESKVAFSNEDINTVLTTGFFHAYGPINNYFD